MKTNRTNQTIIIHPVYSHPILSFSIFLIVVLLVLFTQYWQGELHKESAASVFTFGVLNIAMPLIAFRLYKTFSSLQNTINILARANQQKWFLQQKSLIFGVNIWSILVSFFAALGGTIMNYYAAHWFWTGAAKFFYFLHVVMLYSTLGTLGWAFLGLLQFAFHLKDLKSDPEPFETKKEEIEKISTSFLEIFLAGVILYLGATLAVWLAPLYLIHEMLIFQFLIFPLAIIVTCYFISIQYFLHKVMKNNKEIRINKIRVFMKKYYSKWKKSQLASHRIAINDLFAWQDRIEKEREFPFSILTTVLALVMVFLPITILFFPIIKMIVNLF